VPQVVRAAGGGEAPGVGGHPVGDDVGDRPPARRQLGRRTADRAPEADVLQRPHGQRGQLGHRGRGQPDQPVGEHHGRHLAVPGEHVAEPDEQLQRRAHAAVGEQRRHRGRGVHRDHHVGRVGDAVPAQPGPGERARRGRQRAQVRVGAQPQRRHLEPVVVEDLQLDEVAVVLTGHVDAVHDHDVLLQLARLLGAHGQGEPHPGGELRGAVPRHRPHDRAALDAAEHDRAGPGGPRRGVPRSLRPGLQVHVADVTAAGDGDGQRSSGDPGAVVVLQHVAGHVWLQSGTRAGRRAVTVRGGRGGG
jgi:hypothetical protein